MTDVDLEYPRADAVELVEAVFEDAPSFVSYTVEGDGEKFVGKPKTGATSLGEEVVVRVPKDQDGTSTTITVEARRRVGLNTTANPWKYKSEFLAGVRDLRGEPVDNFPRFGTGEEPASDVIRRAPADGHSGDEQSGSTADAWLLTAKVSGLLLLGLLAAVLLVTVLAAFIR